MRVTKTSISLDIAKYGDRIDEELMQELLDKITEVLDLSPGDDLEVVEFDDEVVVRN